jgi:NADH dehydrogenase
MNTAHVVTVFGGTGFLGRRVVRRLRERAFIVRVASRHLDRSRERFPGNDPDLLSVIADIHDESSITSAIAGAYGVVNAVSLYVEHGNETFQSVHVDAAARLARLSREAGLQRLIHVSGIGSDAASPSPYIRSRGEGEAAVRSAFAGATLIRPAVMFGPDDAFWNTLLKLLRRLPAYPMFGRGATRLQPAHVEDVAQAMARALERDDTRGATIECGGPRVYTYEELLRTVARAAGVQARLIFPVPFAAWHALAWMAEALPHPALTRNQVELMEIDTVVSQGALSLADMRISPMSVEQTLEEITHRDLAA